MPEYFLLEDRIQHSFHGCLHILDGIVDDTVKPDIDALTVRRFLCSCIRAHIESDNDRIGRRCKADIRFVDCTDAAVNDLNDYFIVGQLQKALLNGLY